MRATGGFFAAALVVAVVACDRLTRVNAPDVVQPSSLENASGLEVLRAGVLSRFYSAVVGVTQEGGQMSDELIQTSTAGSETDRRAIPEGGSQSQFTLLSTIRVNALRTIAEYRAVAPNQAAKIAQLFAVVGYTEVFLAEVNCSGAPLSTLTTEPVYGKQLTTAEMFAQALADFDSALATAGGDAKTVNLASVGKGRALLGLGRFADIPAAEAAVPRSFVFQTEHNGTTQQNGLATGWPTKTVATADLEGTNGLNFRTANDPRVVLAANGKGQDGITDIYLDTKYVVVTAPIVMASGIEARLQVSEALLKGGQAQQALDTLNALRQPVAGLAPLTLQATTAAQVDQLFRERAFWLYLTGHRLGDLRRLIRAYGRAQNTVFPVGSYRGVTQYGSDINFVMPLAELNNPNFKGCLDRSQ